MRALVVLPTPRTPVKRKAGATRFGAKAMPTSTLTTQGKLVLSCLTSPLASWAFTVPIGGGQRDAPSAQSLADEVMPMASTLQPIVACTLGKKLFGMPTMTIATQRSAA